MSQQIPQGTFLGHPKGLFLRFATEMWERFSYYGMRALLVLTMVAATDAANPGFGMTTAEALKLYAYYKKATNDYGRPKSRDALINAFKTNALFQAEDISQDKAKQQYIELVDNYFLYRK